MRIAIAALLLPVTLIGGAPADAVPIPSRFDSAGADRDAIHILLATYTRAVSTKNQALFETLLLNKSIPFSDVSSAVRANGSAGGTEHYESFRKAVFDGPPFTQRFQDVHIDQDGPVAMVALVFRNSSGAGESWGWKTLQLLKVGGQWKIASEFYTGHAG